MFQLTNCTLSRCFGRGGSRNVFFTYIRLHKAGRGNSCYVRLLSGTSNSKLHPYELSDEPCPQGVQGDDCSTFRIWQETCSRYGFNNCNEQLQGIQSGRKTLAQVMAEQDKLIADVAAEYRSRMSSSSSSVGQGHSDGQGFQEHYTAFAPINAPCPQGIQGDDCARYKLWLENCHRFGIQDCMEHYASFKSGRKTLAEIFSEQDKIIREIVSKYQQRQYSTSANIGDIEPDKRVEDDSIKDTSPGSKTDGEAGGAEETVVLTRRQKLQRAVKEYGSTVIVFHVAISLASLGFFYLLVSSGLDVAGLLLKLDIGGELLKSKLAAGTGTFVLAYAVHKVFAPVRIATTLTATPFIVRHLRKIGFLKPPAGPK